MTSQRPCYDDVVAAAGRISGVIDRTPVLRSPEFDERAGAEVFVKVECVQVTGSFKIRGAYNRLAQLTPEQKTAGVVAFSSGNHAQGVSRAAKLLGMPALIVMPSDAPAIKINGVRNDGADIHLYERDSENREQISEAIAKERGAIVVPSFDDPDIIAGQGTVGLELVGQVSEPLDHLICCAGGGGLISGIALAFAELSPSTKIWTAEPDTHDDWKRSLEAGEIKRNAPGTRSICDAILTPQPGDLTWAVGGPLLRGGFAVSDAEIINGLQAAYQCFDGLVVEPGGAAALSVAARGLPGEMKGSRVGIVATGGNVDPDDFERYLKILVQLYA